MSVMKKWLSAVRLGESGQVLLAVLAMMVLGIFMVIPVLNYASTSLKTTKMYEENLKGLYAADAGVEDALWRLNYDIPASFPHSYQITDINGMSVDVTIDEVSAIVGEELGESGSHAEWLEIIRSVDYNAETGIYSYSMSLTNNGSGNMKILKILIDLPPALDYVVGSTSSNITIPSNDDPTVIGAPDNGITLKWEIPVNQAPDISVGETEEHNFQLSGPPGIEGVEGHGFVEAHRADLGTVWDSESYPYSITVQAKDDTETVVATIRAGVWQGSQPDISCWQVNP